MKKVLSILIVALLVSLAFADHWNGGFSNAQLSGSVKIRVHQWLNNVWFKSRAEMLPETQNIVNVYNYGVYDESFSGIAKPAGLKGFYMGRFSFRTNYSVGAQVKVEANTGGLQRGLHIIDLDTGDVWTSETEYYVTWNLRSGTYDLWQGIEFLKDAPAGQYTWSVEIIFNPLVTFQ